MITAYGPYSASATGGNGWSRDFLAGVLTVPATPFFTNIGADTGNNLEYASTILACISFVLVLAVYVIYWKGPVLRKRSPFAQRLADDARRNSVSGSITRRASSIPFGDSRRNSKCRPDHVLDHLLNFSRCAPRNGRANPLSGRTILWTVLESRNPYC